MAGLNLNERLDVLIALGKRIQTRGDSWTDEILQASLHNAWFTPSSINKALDGICMFLNAEALNEWISNYTITNTGKKKVGLVLAGNIPLVGFHDLLSTFVSGHIALLKPSEKDTILIDIILKQLIEINPSTQTYFQKIQKLDSFDAVIATGSNNSSRYFEMYFAKYPHIIRQNKHSIAVLHGDESAEELNGLAEDIFTYFGLGCRNVAKIYVPDGYNFDALMLALHEFNDVVLNNKYKNNFDYNIALFMLNKAQYMNNGAVMLVKEKSLASRIASVNYEFYNSIDDLNNLIQNVIDDVQCIVSNRQITGFDTIRPGFTQKPQLWDYADGVDTMKFLTTL